MKKLVLFLILSASVPVYAQSWAAPGATWYYDFQYFSMTGYERIQKIGDTIINSLQYDKLQIYRAYYDQSNQTTGSYYVPQLEFTREDSGVVYYYRDSADYVLYDFNAQVGDSWVLRAENWVTGSMCDTATVVVNMLMNTIVVNGDSLRTFAVSPINWYGIDFIAPVSERIGGYGNLFPYAMCIADNPQGYGLRCYSDSTGWTYHNSNWNYACDDMMSVNDPVQSESFTISASPLTQTLTLNGPQICDGAIIQLYDSRGQLIREETSRTNGTATVNYSGIGDGIYFVTVTTKDFQGSKPFLVVGD